MLKSTLDSVSREVPPDLLLKWNEILSRLTNVLQIAKDARHHWIDPVVSEAIDSLPNRINSQGFDPWGFSPQEAIESVKRPPARIPKTVFFMSKNRL